MTIFRDPDIDVNAVYHQLMATYTSDSDENQQPGTSTGTRTPAGRRRYVPINLWIIRNRLISSHFFCIQFASRCSSQ